MSALTIYKDDHAGNTVVSNRFIDEYLSDANDAQIKVYLYLLRMTSANLPTGISDIADKFNHTEKDVMRSLKYWEKQHLLSLEFNDAKELTGIRFCSPSKEPVSDNRSMAPIIPLKLVADNSVSAETPASSDTIEKAAGKEYPDKPSYSRNELKAFKEAPETNQILFIAETYLQRNLTLSDIEILYFIHHELGFTCDLIDQLLQYCVERDKKSFAYIRKVAINLAEAGVTSPKQARSYFANSYDKEVYTIMKALGRSSNPTPKEAELVMKWYKTYAFSMDVILEACGRTVLATASNRPVYCDRTLESWYKAGVKSLSDVQAMDAAYRTQKASGSNVTTQRPVSAPKNAFNQIDKNAYDFDAIEQLVLKN